jgi:hypothetical protein
VVGVAVSCLMEVWEVPCFKRYLINGYVDMQIQGMFMGI